MNELVDYKRHYVLIAAFTSALLVMALIFLFTHTVILKDNK